VLCKLLLQVLELDPSNIKALYCRAHSRPYGMKHNA
jgi:hypothetical protein